jgi:hypothetical protein
MIQMGHRGRKLHLFNLSEPLLGVTFIKVLFKNVAPLPQLAHCLVIRPTSMNQLMLFTEVLAVSFENHMKPIHTPWAECTVLLMLKRVVHIVTTVLSQI